MKQAAVVMASRRLCRPQLEEQPVAATLRLLLVTTAAILVTTTMSHSHLEQHLVRLHMKDGPITIIEVVAVVEEEAGVVMVAEVAEEQDDNRCPAVKSSLRVT
jgi:hypothetical protein